jgi:hypothetical protein
MKLEHEPMNKTLACVAALSLALGVSACSTIELASASAAIQSGAAVIANINGAMPAACVSAVQIAGDVGSAVAKVGAANPNNATIQSVVAKVNAGVALTAPDCALVSSLLASF